MRHHTNHPQQMAWRAERLPAAESVTSAMLGSSRAMAEVWATIERVAPTAVRVLICGESGVGKELVAQQLHIKSRRNGPLVCLNCAALPDTLVESELFGHEKGAFTGATERQDGRFADANNGTLLLDEVGDMSVPMQAKLLRTLQEGVVHRLGSKTAVHVNARVITATNKDLRREIRRGTFREDLLFRLAVITIVVPPLRDRKDDIPMLVAHFIRTFCSANGREAKTMMPEAIELLKGHRWPGNVRELQNAIERLLILSEGSAITADDVRRRVLSGDHQDDRVQWHLVDWEAIESQHTRGASLKEIAEDHDWPYDAFRQERSRRRRSKNGCELTL